jgi:glycosyltransferase involved in cell wall biosynthesis
MVSPDTSFHILSFEGPDPYARAGGIASRIGGLATALADVGFETHLWFVGDPDRPGEERAGKLLLHRWCQWISRYHGGGVYDGEDGKQSDYASSLPPHLLAHHLRARLHAGGTAIVLAEEWHTVHAVLHLDWLLRRDGLRERVRILWNANNVFGFDRIDWSRLAAAATITTVSRYMSHTMRRYGVEALVIPNGLGEEAFWPVDRDAVGELRRTFADRLLLTKVARFDPDKRWLLAIETTAELKRRGARPLLVARGGLEAHGYEVMAAAATAGLGVRDIDAADGGPGGLVAALREVDGADVVTLRTPLEPLGRSSLFQAAGAVLANSGHEPFGLVGLEAMAAGGIACTGCTGEDYALPGRNALVLQTAEPGELIGLLRDLHADPAREASIRREGEATARAFAWPRIIRSNLLPRVALAGR